MYIIIDYEINSESNITFRESFTFCDPKRKTMLRFVRPRFYVLSLMR